MTVRQKTELAMAEVSGVMIWELGQDHFEEQFSLLNAIYEVLQQGVSSDKNLSESSELKIFPNPFSDFFFVENSGEKEVQIFLSNSNGQLVLNQVIAPFSTVTVQNQRLVAGVYFLKMADENGVANSKVLIKQ